MVFSKQSYKLDLYGLNQTGNNKALLQDFKQFLRNDLKLKFATLEFDEVSHVVQINFQFKTDFDHAKLEFSNRRIQWKGFMFSLDMPHTSQKPYPHQIYGDASSNDNCSDKLSSKDSGRGESPQSLSQSLNKTNRDVMLDNYLENTFPLLSQDYQSQLKSKQDHVLGTYSNLFKQYINFKHFNTFQTFMRNKYGDHRPFIFSNVIPCPCSSEDVVNKLELTVGLDFETEEISVGFPVNEDPKSKNPCRVIPLRDIYDRHCFNIPKIFCSATEIIEKIIRNSKLQIASNMANTMGVWYKVIFRIHNKKNIPHQTFSPQLMIIFVIKPGYKLTPEIIDYAYDIIQDDLLKQNTVQELCLASLYIQKHHPINFNNRTDSDLYLRLPEDHWKYLPEWLRLWGRDNIEDSRMKLKVYPYSEVPPHIHDFNVKTNAVQEMLVDIPDDTYTIVEISCNTGVLSGALKHKCKRIKYITFNSLCETDIENHIKMLTNSTKSSTPLSDVELVSYKQSKTHYNTSNCTHDDNCQCIQCVKHRLHKETSGTESANIEEEAIHTMKEEEEHNEETEQEENSEVKKKKIVDNNKEIESKIAIINNVLNSIEDSKIICLFHNNYIIPNDSTSQEHFCDSFFKLIQYNTKVDKVIFITSSSHNMNSNMIVQCIPYVICHVTCLDSKPNSNLYDALVLLERIEPTVSHDNRGLENKFNHKMKLIEEFPIEKLKLKEKQAIEEKRLMVEEMKQRSEVQNIPHPPSKVASPQPSANMLPPPKMAPIPVTNMPPHGMPPMSMQYPPPPFNTSPFLPRVLPPPRLPPPPSSYQPRQRFGPPDVYPNARSQGNPRPSQPPQMNQPYLAKRKTEMNLVDNNKKVKTDARSQTNIGQSYPMYPPYSAAPPTSTQNPPKQSLSPFQKYEPPSSKKPEVKSNSPLNRSSPLAKIPTPTSQPNMGRLTQSPYNNSPPTSVDKSYSFQPPLPPPPSEKPPLPSEPPPKDEKSNLNKSLVTPTSIYHSHLEPSKPLTSHQSLLEASKILPISHQPESTKVLPLAEPPMLSNVPSLSTPVVSSSLLYPGPSSLVPSYASLAPGASGLSQVDLLKLYEQQNMLAYSSLLQQSGLSSLGGMVSPDINQIYALQMQQIAEAQMLAVQQQKMYTSQMEEQQKQVASLQQQKLQTEKEAQARAQQRLFELKNQQASLIKTKSGETFSPIVVQQKTPVQLAAEAHQMLNERKMAAAAALYESEMRKFYGPTDPTSQYYLQSQQQLALQQQQQLMGLQSPLAGYYDPALASASSSARSPMIPTMLSLPMYSHPLTNPPSSPYSLYNPPPGMLHFDPLTRPR